MSTDVAVGARSYLYVPGDRPERFAKALASGADAVILDLEDAVALPAKDVARAHVAEALAGADAPCERWVRVNQGERGIADLEALAGLPGLTGAFLPKATAATVEPAVRALGGRPVVALVESAAAVLALEPLARAAGVRALAMGEVDLGADLGLDPDEADEALWPVRLSVVAASVVGGLLRPVGPVWVAVRDLDGLGASTAVLRRRGFGARQAIHPDQVGPINEAFTPTAEEVDRARELLAGAEGASGVWVGPDGRMVDEAVLRGARATLALAERWS